MSNAPNDAVDTAEVELVKSYAPSSSNTFIVDEYSAFAQHPVLFLATDWSSGSINATLTDDIFRTYLTTADTGGYVNKKHDNFMFTNASLRVTVVVQGSSVAQGKLILSFDPLPHMPEPGGVPIVRVPVPQKTRCLLIPHLEINPNENKAYTIDLPPPTVWGVYSFSKGPASGSNLGSYRMRQTIINTLGSGTAVVPQVSFAVYLSLCPGKLSSITTSADFTSAIKKEKSEKGLISSYFKKAAEVVSFGAFVPVPEISAGATLFSTYLGVTGEVLSWFGFSKPVSVEHHASWVNSTNNYTKVDGSFQADVLSLRNNYSLGLGDDQIPLMKLEEMETAWLANKPGLVRTYTIATAAAPNLLIGILDVAPQINRITDDPAVVNGYELTPLSFSALPYRYWRGDIKFTVEFVCSVFHRVTVVALYEPSGSTVPLPYLGAMGALQHWTMNVSGNTTFELDIPWKQIEHFRELCLPTSDAASAFCNGTITFFLLHPVTTNGSTDPVHMNVYMSGSEMAYGGDVQFSSINPVVLTSMQKTGDKMFFSKYFGEEHAHTLKELANRMTQSCRMTYEATALGAIKPVLTVPYGTLVGAPSPTTSILGVNIYQSYTLLDILSASYVGIRGSMNYSFFPSSGVSDGVFTDCMVKTDFQNNRTGFVLDDGGGLNIFKTFEGWNPKSIMYGKIRNSLDFVIPYRSEGLFVPTYPSTILSPLQVAKVEMFANRTATARGITTICSSTLLSSGGDDFCMVGYRGTPLMTYT